MKLQFIGIALVLGTTVPVQAGPVTQLLETYTAQGAQAFSAQSGRQMWSQVVTTADGEKRSCTSCHGSQLDKPGKHVKTGKVIQPMSPAVNPDRLSDVKKIEKWFKRNCKWTLSRECSAQEKGDLLMFLQQQ